MSRLVYIEEPVSDNDAPFDEDYISDDYYALKSDFKATKRSKPTPSSKPHSSLPVKERGELKKKSSNRRERGRKGGEDDNEGDNNLVNEEEEEILASFHTAPDIQIRNGSDKRQKIVVEREDFAEDLKTKEKEKKKKKKKEKEKRSLEANNESHSVSENNAVIDLTCDSPSPESPSLSAQNVASSLASSPNIDPPSSSSSSGQESRLRKLAVSSWLKSFLAHKRDNSSIPPPFEEPSSDSILRDFAADFKGSQFDEEINTKEEIVLDDDELLLFPEDNAEEIISRESLRLKQNQDLLNAEEEKTSSVTLNLFNLPYSATEMTLRNLLEPLGVTLQSVTIKMDKKKNLPAGSASITVVCEAEQVETLIGMIKEQELSGRKLRVEEGNGVSRRGTRTSEGGMGRYFGGVDMSCKCFDCGEVGHKASDCPNETLPVPCGLCAGLDHDSQACPNIICYRCGSFGHHSRRCSSARNCKASVCTLCGSSSHVSRACNPDVSLDTVTARFEGEHVICMSCGRNGHVCCRPRKTLADNRIYCPNCGQEGHHIDIRRVNGTSSSHTLRAKCTAPTNEAYIKFPSLIEYNVFGKTQRENNAYFEKLIAECNYHYEDLRPLFPSLPPIETRDNNNNSNHRTSYSSTSSSSSAAYSSRQPSLNHIRDYKETQRASYGTASRTVYQSENAHHHGRGGTQEVVSRGVTYFPRGNDRSSSGPSRDTRRDYSYGRHSY